MGIRDGWRLILEGGVKDKEIVASVGRGSGLCGKESGSIAEVGTFNHPFGREARCPFKNLRVDGAHEGAGAPMSEEHDAEDGGVGKEECHGGARVEGMSANVGWMVSKDVETSTEGASGA
ncbi:hypothetical protein ACA910_001516 [Epithemia clementina (nom. ined.)]